MPSHERMHFSVHPSIVYQLGESLITDGIQALVELVKNSYDADATYAKVVIETLSNPEYADSLYESQGGRIRIEDDGNGMDLDEIKSGWLVISNRKKRDLKLAKGTTPGGRTPLGDKGLGRLGVQRLGDKLEILTKSQNEEAYHLAFSWLDFETAPSLEQVDIHLERIEFGKPHGTTVIISDLLEIESWRGQRSLIKLEERLSQMISPYRGVRQFAVMVEVDGKTLDLVEISDKVRDISPLRYAISFKGSKFKVEGKASLDLFRPSSVKDGEQFALAAEKDDGKAFFEFLKDQKIARSIGLCRSRSKKWFVEFGWDKDLEDLDKVERDIAKNGRIANPGPFVGEIDSFDLGAAAFRRQSVFDRLSDYRKHIKKLSGIRVYRDGFSIKVDHDWLKLGEQWTSAPSYYGLKPDTTLGYVALSAKDNMQLEETTDREGFKDTPYYRNFYSLLNDFMRFTGIAHELFGRSWSAFAKKKREDHARVDSRKSVEDISKSISEGLAGASELERTVLSIKTEIQQRGKAAQNIFSASGSPSKRSTDDAREIAADLQILVEKATGLLEQVSTFLNEVSLLRELGHVLEDRVQGLRRQMDEMYEAVALGLTAEALSHEVFNIADQLANRTKAAQTRLAKLGVKDSSLLAFVEYVKSAIMSLRKQISFLSPSLRYVRDQRHNIEIESFIKELADFYKERFEKNLIAIKIRSSSESKFNVRINKGKLTQIVDNMMLNSEYWLKEQISQKATDNATVDIEIHRPFVYIFDSGKGIDPTVEASIFEPFITTKGKGLGRGLGLFIVKQLLDSEGCSVTLMPERNQYDRLFKFKIDLRGALDDS